MDRNLNVYLIEYYDIIKDCEDYIIVTVDENIVEIEPNIADQIFNYKYLQDKHQGEINIITMERLYGATESQLSKYNFLDIKGKE